MNARATLKSRPGQRGHPRKRAVPSRVAPASASGPVLPAGVIGIRANPLRHLLAQLAGPAPRALIGAASDEVAACTASPVDVPSVEEQHNATLGCRTSDVALHVLSQVVRIEQPNFAADTPQEQVDQLLCKATAMVAELEPETATETLLAAQMVGAQHLAMTFMRRALVQTDPQLTDANVLRATRLMRLFNEQLEAMAKLKGKSGQQRVVVEHVTVNEGGQAIVGAVAATKAISAGRPEVA
jgi:hypothetical protein